MKELPEFTYRNSHFYILLHKEGGYCLYEQIVPEDGKIAGYDVFKIQISPKREIFGTPYPEYEKYPHKDAFGQWAWSFYSLEKAMEKFNSLLLENLNAQH